MSDPDELVAAKLIEEYIAAKKAGWTWGNGRTTFVLRLLARCPTEQREALHAAVDGYDFAAQNHPALLVSDELVDKTMNLIQVARQDREVPDDTPN